MSRLALISDVHGNDVAFAAVAEDIARVGVDDVVCLGDVAQGGAQPKETLRRLRALRCRTVLGNADAYLLETPDRPVEVRDWTLAQLDDDDIALMRTFEERVVLEFAGATVVCFHGSPRNYDDILLPEYPESSLEPYRSYGSCDLLAGGHTHRQWTTRIDRALFVNPGSVGLADAGRLTTEEEFRQAYSSRLPSCAEYALAVVDHLGVSVEFRRVPFPPGAMVEAAQANGHPLADQWAAIAAA